MKSFIAKLKALFTKKVEPAPTPIQVDEPAPIKKPQVQPATTKRKPGPKPAPIDPSVGKPKPKRRYNNTRKK